MGLAKQNPGFLVPLKYALIVVPQDKVSWTHTNPSTIIKKKKRKSFHYKWFCINYESVRYTKCGRIQECIMYRVQGSEVCYAQSALFRNVICTGSRFLECFIYRVQGSGKH